MRYCRIRHDNWGNVREKDEKVTEARLYERGELPGEPVVIRPNLAPILALLGPLFEPLLRSRPLRFARAVLALFVDDPGHLDRVDQLGQVGHVPGPFCTVKCCLSAPAMSMWSSPDGKLSDLYTVFDSCRFHCCAIVMRRWIGLNPILSFPG